MHTSAKLIIKYIATGIKKENVLLAHHSYF